MVDISEGVIGGTGRAPCENAVENGDDIFFRDVADIACAPQRQKLLAKRALDFFCRILPRCRHTVLLEVRFECHPEAADFTGNQIGLVGIFPDFRPPDNAVRPCFVPWPARVAG